MTFPKTLRIATRKSPLALRQTEIIKQALQINFPDLMVEIVGIVTEGDKRLDVPLTEIGGKGLFVKELEKALLTDKADIAVHSIKDIPSHITADLILASVFQREDARDVLVSNRFANLDELPTRAIIGTSSLRRACQLKMLRPDLQIRPLRGNIQTRLGKLDESEFDGIILAAAGLKRLELNARICQFLSPQQFIPAVGQGALGIECRKEDTPTQELLAPLNHLATRYCIDAERAFNQTLEGGCQVPIAAHANLVEEQLNLIGLVGHPDGSIVLRASLTGPKTEAIQLGQKLAQKLLAIGAHKILRGNNAENK